MRLPKTAVAALFATFSFLVVPACYADDVDPSADNVAVAAPPTRSLFASWFGTKTPKTEAAIAEADAEEAHMNPAQPAGGTTAGTLVVGALGLLGIGYRLGGSSPTSGFDCSGMVRYVFSTALGLDLPRRAEEISRIGSRVDRSELKPGDLVFYKTLRKTFSHVGIYLGNNRFIHAPSAGGAVRVDDMTQSYWTARFNGARRVAS